MPQQCAIIYPQNKLYHIFCCLLTKKRKTFQKKTISYPSNSISCAAWKIFHCQHWIYCHRSVSLCEGVHNLNAELVCTNTHSTLSWNRDIKILEWQWGNLIDTLPSLLLLNLVFFDNFLLIRKIIFANWTAIYFFG